MKRVIFVLFTALMAFALAGMAESPDGVDKNSRRIIKVTFEKAVQNPGLVKAMYAQLDKSMLNSNQKTYVGRVYYEGHLYLIYGNYDQWYGFFTKKWKYAIEKNTFGITHN